MKLLIKNPRIILWLFFIVLAIYLISPNPNPQGIVVTSVDKVITPNIDLGEIIYSINGVAATTETIGKNYVGVVKLDTNKGSKYTNANGTLGLGVEGIPVTKIKFGLDLKGGVHAILEPNMSTNATIAQIITTLENRINFYGLRESVFRPIYYGDKAFIEVSIAGGTEEELKTLIESQGNFEAKIPLLLDIKNNVSTIVLDKNYAVFVNGSVVIVDEKSFVPGDTFSLSGIDFTLNGINVNKLNVTATVFTGDDVIAVFYDPQRSRIEPVENGYRWSFGVQLSSTGAQNFAWVTQNTKVVQDLQSGYLDSPIMFYLDNRLVDSLSISAGLKGRAETEISITGSAKTIQDAMQIKTQLQSILKSGALPTTVEIVQLDSISPTLGSGFLKSALIAALVALVGVIILVSLRYRKPKLVLPMIAISITEIMIVIGLAVSVGWTVDLAAIAGLIASVGTGISDQIIILDRVLRKDVDSYDDSMKQKIKNAFFVVFGTAGTVIAAMLPLLFTSFGILRGFALITILGVLVGIFITRPAYGAIVEYLTKE
jgi:protein-export membrane protein SecD